MRTSRSTLRSALAAVTVAAAMTAGAGAAVADQQDDPNGEKNATSCDEKDVELAGQKLVKNGDVLVEGFEFEFTGGEIEQDKFVTIDDVDPDFAVSGVVVKGGDGYNVYVVGEDLAETPQWQDLRAPDNNGNQIPGISHWYICGHTENGDDTTTSSPTDTEISTPPESDTSTTPGGGETTTPGGTTTTEGTTSSPSSSQPVAPTVTSTTEAVPAVSSDDTENLAYTGFNNAWLVWLGGALVLAGAAALVLLRVRRSRS